MSKALSTSFLGRDAKHVSGTGLVRFAKSLCAGKHLVWLRGKHLRSSARLQHFTLSI